MKSQLLHPNCPRSEFSYFACLACPSDSAEEYKSDFEKYVAVGRTMHDPFPSVIVIKGYGLVTAASSKREADIVRDEAIHSFRVASAAAAISENKFITDADCFDMEYWPFQEAKLARKKKGTLEGYIGLVTGAASGIGKVTFSRFVPQMPSKSHRTSYPLRDWSHFW